jgi:hypothetical protein
VLLLLSVTNIETGFTVMHFRGNLTLAFLNLGVVGTLRLGARLHSNSVRVKLGLDRGRPFSNGLSKDYNITAFLDSEREPLVHFFRKFLLAGKGMWDMEEGAGGGDNDTLLAESLNGTLQQLYCLLEVVLPDITTVNNAHRQDLLGTKLLDDWLKLFWVAHKVDVKAINVGESRQNIEVVNDVSEVGSDSDLRRGISEGSNGFIGRLKSLLNHGSQVENKYWFIYLHALNHAKLAYEFFRSDVRPTKISRNRDSLLACLRRQP